MSAPIHLGSFQFVATSLEAHHQFTIEFARARYLQNGELEPLWFLAKPGAAMDVIMTLWDDEDEKVRSIAAVRACMKAMRTTIYSQMNEVWMARYSRDEIDQPGRPPPSKRADREEALFIASYTQEDFRISRCLILSSAPAALGKIEHLSESDKFEGRMFNLLRQGAG